MKNGIYEKDIRDFERYALKLAEVIERIREYKPEAYLYATPGEFNLMSGVLEENASKTEEQELRVTNIFCRGLECGDW